MYVILITHASTAISLRITVIATEHDCVIDTINQTDTNQGSFQDQRIFVCGDTPVIFYGKEAESVE